MTEMDSSPRINSYSFSGFTFDLNKRCLLDSQGVEKKLSSRAIDTLLILVEERGQVLSKEYLLEKVWSETYVEENNLNQAVTSLRKALDDSKDNSRFIKTVVGRGYCFVAEVEIEGGPAQAESLHAAEPSSSHFLNALAPKLHTRLLFKAALGLSVVLISALILLHFIQPTFLDSAESTSNASLSTATAPSIDAPTPVAGNGSIAILPFNYLNTIQTEEDAAIAVSLKVELENQLSRLSDLNVVPDEGVTRHMLQDLTLAEMGQTLGVDYLVTGSIFDVNSRLRVILNVVEPETGFISWSYGYYVNAQNLTNLVQAQSDIAFRLSSALDADFSETERNATFTSPSQSFEANRLNLAARHALRLQDYPKVWSLTKEAIAVDPDFHGALYNYASANVFLAAAPMPNMSAAEHLQMAMETADQMIQLNPEQHEGYLLKAVVHGALGQWEEAMQIFDDLVELNSPLWDMYLMTSTLMSIGDSQTAISILEANLEVYPLNGYGRRFLVSALESTGNREQARREYEVGEQLVPSGWGATNAIIALGRDEEITNFLDLEFMPAVLKDMLVMLVNDELVDLKNRLQLEAQKQEANAYENVLFAAIAAKIGENSLALEFMNGSTSTLPGGLHWYWLPVFEQTRQEQGFKDMLEGLGMISYWEKNGWPSICRPTGNTFVCDNLNIFNEGNEPLSAL